MKTKTVYARLKNRIKHLTKINASVEVLIFNIRIITFLAERKGPIYYIYLP